MITDRREPEEIIDPVIYPKVAVARQSRSKPQAGAVDWRGRYAPPSKHGGTVKDFYAVPTIAQVRYYRNLGGQRDPNGLYRGEISDLIGQLIAAGSQTARAARYTQLHELRKAEDRRDGAYRRQKQASWAKFFIGGKRS